MKLYIVKARYECGDNTAMFITTEDKEKADKYCEKLDKLLDKWVTIYCENIEAIQPHRRQFLLTMCDCYVEEVEVLTDVKRHLICNPYNLDNLHKVAEYLDIKRCWFHKNHYDIPKRRIEEIGGRTKVISSKEIVKIINGE